MSGGEYLIFMGTIARVARPASAAARIGILCMLCAGAGFGCARTRRAPLTERDDTTINIQIENRAFENATVHVIWRGRRLRLGTVIGHTTADYRVEWENSALLRFEIDLLAGPSCNTEQIWADPGDIIIMEISPQFLDSASCLR